MHHYVINLDDIKSGPGTYWRYTAWVDHACPAGEGSDHYNTPSRFGVAAEANGSDLVFSNIGWVLYDGEYNPRITYCPHCGQHLREPPAELLALVRDWLKKFFAINGPPTINVGKAVPRTGAR